MAAAFASEAAWPEVKLDAKEEALMANEEVYARQRFRRTQKLCVVLLLPVAVITVVACRAILTAQGPSVEAEFESFISRFGRDYGSQQERDVRFAIFKANYELVQSENAKGLPYSLAVNEFSDMTSAEFRAGHLGLEIGDGAGGGFLRLAALPNATEEALPTSVDWTKKGAVTSPKNQGSCGSCWSFSTTGALEGAWQIATGKLVSLSEQQFVDCDKSNNACGGGLMDKAFTFAKDHGICTEKSYPYVAKSTTCRQTKCTVAIPAGGVVGFRDITPNDEAALMAAVAKQPVAVAIEADQTAFQLYNGGVLTKECGANLDHGVLLVGYGVDQGVPYWKVKNSWGSSWGEGGFIRLQRGVKGSGKCGINSMASVPVVKAKGDEAEALV